MKNLKLFVELVRAVRLAIRIASEPMPAPQLVRVTVPSGRRAG